MPKLMIRQKVFSWGDHFDVMNEHDEILYHVEGEVFTLGHKLHVYDNLDREIIFIREKPWSFLPCFFVTVDGEQAAEIVREWSFLHPRFSIHGPNWTLEGDLWGHEYRILEGERQVACISKAWFSWGDFYTVDIPEKEDTLLALAVVLSLDCVIASETAAASAAN